LVVGIHRGCACHQAYIGLHCVSKNAPTLVISIFKKRAQINSTFAAQHQNTFETFACVKFDVLFMLSRFSTSDSIIQRPQFSSVRAVRCLPLLSTVQYFLNFSSNLLFVQPFLGNSAINSIVLYPFLIKTLSSLLKGAFK